ncbi:MAG: RNA polymerase subunit sigma-70 [Lachnospiraceae bacterium]|nr:RNA polymerase subunit sigma-70 [Lachnospiraceae bacterium]
MHDDVYQMYLEEVRRIPACTPQEEEGLCRLVRAGDRKARERLLEGMLYYALELARTYKGRGLSAGDLAQEANLALILAVDQYQSGDLREQIGAMVAKNMEAAIEEQRRECQVAEELVARVNVLKDVSKIMAEELGREATVEELAKKMKMTVNEIKGIMKLTLDAMSVSPDAEI